MKMLVIGSNILTSALIKDSLTRNLIKNMRLPLLFPEYGLSEVYLCKQEILKKSHMNGREFNVILLRLMKYIRLIPSGIILDFICEADKIIGKIDKDDSVFIATALAFNCSIWSDDKHLKKQDKVRVFTTKEMAKMQM
ncbi:MAG: hypothetical protein KKB21_05560 [Nanoarchaeota archaeon]|nr:hypothetical protein [Nanoarchaeota archaeon]